MKEPGLLGYLFYSIIEVFPRRHFLREKSQQSGKTGNLGTKTGNPGGKKRYNHGRQKANTTQAEAAAPTEAAGEQGYTVGDCGQDVSSWTQTRRGQGVDGWTLGN